MYYIHNTALQYCSPKVSIWIVGMPISFMRVSEEEKYGKELQLVNGAIGVLRVALHSLFIVWIWTIHYFGNKTIYNFTSCFVFTFCMTLVCYFIIYHYLIHTRCLQQTFNRCLLKSDHSRLRFWSTK